MIKTHQSIGLTLRFLRVRRVAFAIIAGILTSNSFADTYAPPLHAQQDRVISLAVEWALKLDPQKVGVAQHWFKRSFSDRIQLPGTLDEHGKGPLNEERPTRKLTRARKFTGPAWFQREINLPADWTENPLITP